MQTLWLILSAVFLPLVWGFAVYRLMGWLWPEKQRPIADLSAPHRLDPLADYQI